MTQYAMTTRMGSVVIKTNANNLEEAINYFAKMKQLPREKFMKLFLVTEISK
tara:strand:+ start:222 stop:377 length:156 start_codon:yes stop_codon:yes gene_type:complete